MTAEAAYQGAPASFSEQAARLLCGSARELLGCRTFDELFDSLAAGRVGYGVVPVENAIVGLLPFLDGQAVWVERELRLRVSHALVGAADARLTHVRRVLVHPVAAAQCRRWLAGRGLDVEPVWDGAAAVIDVLRNGATDTAALAPERAAAQYGGVVLAARLEDRRDNWTRFALVRRTGPHEVSPRTPRACSGRARLRRIVSADTRSAATNESRQGKSLGPALAPRGV